jgi:hypothetical protein
MNAQTAWPLYPLRTSACASAALRPRMRAHARAPRAWRFCERFRLARCGTVLAFLRSGDIPRRKEVRTMKYTTPELIVLGPASVLVQGGEVGKLDSLLPNIERPPTDLALGLDA